MNDQWNGIFHDPLYFGNPVYNQLEGTATVPSDQGQVNHLSPWSQYLADDLFLNKLLLWNQPHLSGWQRYSPNQTAGNWSWPQTAANDPEG